MPADNTEVSARNQHETTSRTEDPEALLNEGLALLAEGNVLDASACFERAIYLKPYNPQSYYNLGQSLRRQGRLIEAANAYRKAISQAPDMAGPHLSFGELKLFHGNFAGAVESLQRAAELEPGSAAVHAQLGKALMAMGRFDDAELAYRTSLGLVPESAEANALLGEMLVQVGRLEEGQALLNRAIELEPSQPDPYLSYVNARTMTASDRPLNSRLMNLLKNEGMAPEERGKFHFALGKLQDDLGDYRNAIRNYDEANGIEVAKRQVSRQFFNPQSYLAYAEGIVRSFTKEFFETHIGLGSASELPVFLVGVTGAETETVSSLLSAHPKIGNSGELSFWHERGAREIGQAGSTPQPEKVARVAREYEALLAHIAPGKERVLNSMPHNFLMLGPIFLAFPRARVVHCRRNPLDTCLEAYMTYFGGSSPPFAHDRGNIVFFHEVYMRLMDHWRAALPPGRLLEVSCEDIDEDPQAAAITMADFCGLDWGPAHSGGGSPNVARQPARKLPIGHWKHYEQWLGAFAKFKADAKEVQPSTAKRSKT